MIIKSYFPKLSLLLLSLAACLISIGQTATIQSVDEVCLNELITFQINISGGTATSYSWNLGDNTTSTQKNPSHTYNTFGAKTINLTVTFSGGTTVTDSKTITVHDLPTADFDIDSSNYCFYSQSICLKDKSTMGQTTTGYKSRLTLWGDGAQTTSNFPNSNPVYCYSSYPKPDTKPYTITIEVQNDKGCEDKWTRDITILEDYKPSFQYKRDGASCTDQKVCFFNDSSLRDPRITSFEWDFGDGNTSTADWAQACHTYSTQGTFRVKLKVTLANGCESFYNRLLRTNIQDFDVKPLIEDSVICFPNTFNVKHLSIPGANYTWEIYDQDTQFVANAGFGIVDFLSVPCPGFYLMRLKVRVGNCSRYSRFINLNSQGIAAEFIPLNQFQCFPQDTVYTYNVSKVHPDADPVFTWNFSDTNAAYDCWGWKNNCTRDDDEHSRHFYHEQGCFRITLKAEDRNTGCNNFYEDSVFITDPAQVEYSYDAERLCYGSKSDYNIGINNNVCYGKFELCTDSLANDKDFIPSTGVVYNTVADEDGWVTVGIASEYGDEKVYHSPDTSDYTIEPNNICRDTIWKHHWFRLHPEPTADLVVEKDGICLPITSTIKYTGSEPERFRYLMYKWNDALPFEIDTLDGTVNKVSNVFKQEGSNKISVVLEDTNGCYAKAAFPYKYGYFNSFDHEAVVCIGKEVIFKDTIRYYGDATPYWRIFGRPETISWNFGRSDTFMTSNTFPIIQFDSIGVYDIRMATTDENGCSDTAYSQVLVGNIIAAMEDNSEDYLCDQIIQFFDSSYFSFPNSGDKIKEWYWDFGDNTKESYLQNPFHYYSKNGAFTVTLAVETESGCKDTTEIPIYLKGPEPYFTLLTDSVGCAPFRAEFKSESELVSAYNWYMGDPNNSLISASNDTTISFTYDQPGIYYIRLEGSDSFYNSSAGNTYTCSAVYPDTASGDTLIRVVVIPVPEAGFTAPEPICVGQSVIFRQNSDTLYTDHNWQIEDLYTTTEGDLPFVFERAGQYDIVYAPTYVPEGPYQRKCFDTASNTVQVFDVNAKFSVEAIGECNEFNFYDSSENAVSYYWDFDHPKSGKKNNSTDPNPSHSYGSDSGTYNVILIVENQQGCLDTFDLDVVSTYFSELNLYNVFTPNADGNNDEFLFEVVNQDVYDLKVFNRYGELVFETSDPTVGWNGKLFNEEIDLPESTYFYILKLRFACQKEVETIEGQVELIR